MAIQSQTTSQTISGQQRSSIFAAWSPYSYSFSSSSTNNSISHKGWKEAGLSDIGGPWFLTKDFVEVAPIMVQDSTINGPVFAQEVIGWSFSPRTSITDSEMKANGTKAISLSTPNNPSFSVAQALGEAREGFPHIIGSGILKDHSNLLRNAGDEYLNVEFGWKPMMNDLRNFAKSVKNRNQIISNYVAGSGTKIRRRHDFPESNTVRETVGSAPANPAFQLLSATTYETQKSRAWFSGAFRYYVPVGDDLSSKLARYESEANKLLGVRLTPATVWELTPWSWAADWFGNTGDIMTNISNLGSDSMVMQYGYSMCNRSTEIQTTFHYGGKTGTFRRYWEQKRRIPASPYGFELSFNGFSDRQKAIVAALGMSRV